MSTGRRMAKCCGLRLSKPMEFRASSVSAGNPGRTGRMSVCLPVRSINPRYFFTIWSRLCRRHRKVFPHAHGFRTVPLGQECSLGRCPIRSGARSVPLHRGLKHRMIPRSPNAEWKRGKPLFVGLTFRLEGVRQAQRSLRGFLRCSIVARTPSDLAPCRSPASLRPSRVQLQAESTVGVLQA
jgi:hypothetical protein